MTAATFVLDPSAWLPSGHHLQFDLALVEELKRAGSESWLFIHREATGAATDHPATVRHFSVFPGKPLSDDPLVGDLETYLAQNRAFAADLRAFAGTVNVAGALIVFPNMLHHMLLGLAEWLEEYAASARPRLALLFPGYSGYEGPTGGLGWIFALYRHGFNALRRVAGEAPVLLSLTPQQAAEYTFLAGRDVEVAPYPTPASLWRGTALVRAEGRRPRVAVLGGSSGRKGFGLLPEIAALTLAAHPDAEFVIQVNIDGLTAPDAATVDALRRLAPAVRLLEGYIDQAGFFQTILDSDFVLLPYRSPMYRTGSSALFEDTAYLGRPCIVPPDTSMAASIAAGTATGLVASGSAAADFADAVIGALRDRDRLVAAAMSATAAKRASAGMDRFARRLLEIG